uniref:Putative salivary secreted peptide n=1 Tax=Ixodes ricinus TaxID=34613 RepID=A0A6B0V087_IXORI
MKIKWMLAYILLSSSLVFGNAAKVENSTNKAPETPKKPVSSNATPAEKKTTASTSTQAKQTKTSPKATAAPQPPAPLPSTDPIICDLEKNKSAFALPSLQCTLRELPQNLKDNLTRYMTNGGKNETDLLEEICEAIKNNKNPEFMSNYKEDDKDMIHDTSTLCRIRRTTKSECEMPSLII